MNKKVEKAEKKVVAKKTEVVKKESSGVLKHCLYFRDLRFFSLRYYPLYISLP